MSNIFFKIIFFEQIFSHLVILKNWLNQKDTRRNVQVKYNSKKHGSSEAKWFFTNTFGFSLCRKKDNENGPSKLVVFNGQFFIFIYLLLMMIN